MPGLDGFEVLETLRGDASFAATPIVVLTASAMRGDRERALASRGFHQLHCQTHQLAAPTKRDSTPVGVRAHSKTSSAPGRPCAPERDDTEHRLSLRSPRQSGTMFGCQSSFTWPTGPILLQQTLDALRFDNAGATRIPWIAALQNVRQLPAGMSLPNSASPDAIFSPLGMLRPLPLPCSGFNRCLRAWM